MPPPRPATEKVGNIRKCPNCGAEVPSMTAFCSSCGHEFSNMKVASSVQKLFDKLDALDEKIYDTSSDKVDVGTQLATHFFGSGGTKRGDKAKINLIESFPIPNSKEDIIEFIILASSRINYSGADWMGNQNYFSETRELEKYNNAWKSKMKQAHTKARIAFSNDKEAMAQIMPILNEFNAADAKARKKKKTMTAIMIIVTVVIIVALFVLGAALE
jgi:predicted nucleic acid-binding Zn ribbon protein